MRLLSLHALIAAAALSVCACANHGDIRSLTYDYTDQTRKAAEWRAVLAMQDSCFASGYQRARAEGPPQVVSEGGQLRATQAYSCVGTVGSL